MNNIILNASLKLRAVFLLLLVAPCMLIIPQISYARDSIRCESYRGSQQFCRADTRDGVHLSRQYSRAPCRENDTWGYDRRGVWVANGCAAEFSLGRDNSDNTAGILIGVLAAGLIGAAILNSNDSNASTSQYGGQPGQQYVERDDASNNYGNNFGYVPPNSNVVRCESGMNSGVARCSARISRGVEIMQMVPGSFECKFKESWGYDQQGIWVSRGCRADFQVS